MLNNIKRGSELIRKTAKDLPKKPGIYKMLNEQHKPIYIGKAKNLAKRVISYANIEKLPTRLKRMVAQVISIEVITTNTEAEALLLEANLIQTNKPTYNIALRDDKSFPYILIEDKHQYPRVSKYRGKLKNNGTYFGPFASAGSVNKSIAELQKVFLIRPCSDTYFANRDKPCLQYQIKRCSAPCVGKISQADYHESIKQVKDLLSGKTSNVQQQLARQMEQASGQMQYERAAILRDRISALTQLQAKNLFNNFKIKDADIIAFYKNQHDECCIWVFFIRGGRDYGGRSYFFSNISDGMEATTIETFMGQFYQYSKAPKLILTNIKLENDAAIAEAISKLADSQVAIKTPKLGHFKELMEFALENAKNYLSHHQKGKLKNRLALEEVKKLFHLKELPSRIEVYDNSHHAGSNAYGCMIVATPEGFDKTQYRKYSMKHNTQDDYAMLKEMLTRRLAKLDEENYPDVMLIDGGRGHYTTAREVLDSFGITDVKLVCIAKGRQRRAGKEKFYMDNAEPFTLIKGSITHSYLQLIRDEVHRFAITSHRKKSVKDITKSIISNIDGVGELRKKILLNHFGSAEAISNASVTDLCKVEGINLKIAKNIFSYLHPQEQR
ncbi:MAG: excinuclease ABC subunit UvrC [Rickettsiales bacterium]